MVIGPGCVCCGCRNEMLNLNHLCVACQVAIERDLRRERAEQIHALRVFGEVIATIARAGLVVRASMGQALHSRVGGNAAFYGPGDVWFVYCNEDHEPTHELPSPHPADRAAEVVSLLFGEVGR